MKKWIVWLGAIWAVVVLVVLSWAISTFVYPMEIRCYSEQEIHYLFFGSRTTYERARGNNLTRLTSESNCQPLQIWAFIRHGARYPEIDIINKYALLDQLRDTIIENHAKGRGQLCDSDLELLKQWTLMPPVSEMPPDQLHENGKEEMRQLGKRLKNTFPELLSAGSIAGVSQKDYRFRSTDKQRTRATQAALIDGIFKDEGITIEPEDVPKNDTFLYVNMNCPAYQDSLKLNRPWNETDAFTENGTEFRLAQQRISERLGFVNEIDTETFVLIWEICRYETASKRYGQWSTWCLVFDPEDIQAFEYREDLSSYYYAGPGRLINKMAACPVVKDLIQRFRNVVRYGREESAELRGAFYIGHTFMLGATMGALGMTKSENPFLADNYVEMVDRKFRTSLVGPFGGNVIFVLYRCDSDNKSTYKVTIHASERPWPLLGCPDGVCDWEVFEQKYMDFADNCNLDFCYQ